LVETRVTGSLIKEGKRSEKIGRKARGPNSHEKDSSAALAFASVAKSGEVPIKQFLAHLFKMGFFILTMSEKTFLSVEEVAKKFGVNPTTVYRLAQRGALPAFKIGNQWRFSLEMLKVWVSDQVNYDRMQKESDAESKNSDS